MFSNQTLYELVRILDKMKTSDIRRIISVFNFTPTPIWEKITHNELVTGIFNDLRYRSNSKAGPFSDNIHVDLLQFLIDEYLSNGSANNGYFYSGDLGPPVNFNQAFALAHPRLMRTLKRDGYFITGSEIQKLLPHEIREAKIESELLRSLVKFKFDQTKGHLTQAINNHSAGNWAAANGQFRSFIESLMIEICAKLLPSNRSATFSQSVKLLSETLSPPFLSSDLNELPKKKDSDSFVEGLWVRLHPNGSHPGLSDEDDCTFRYHMTVVFANYLLRRLNDRI